MSSSLSGSETIPGFTTRFDIQDSSQIGEARRFAAKIGQELGLDETTLGRAAIVLNELGTNLLRHARGGSLLVRFPRREHLRAIEILSMDEGPGFNVDQCMRDGATSGSTPGTGLGAIRRQSTLFDVVSNERGSVILSLVAPAQDADAWRQQNFRFDAIATPYPGEKFCGDGWCTWEDGDTHLLVVADGLGHGLLAHEASREALQAIPANWPQVPLEMLMSGIHARLRSTRGAAVLIMRLSRAERSATVVSVGNVRAFIATLSGTKSFLSYPGTVGLQYRSVKAITLPIPPNAFVVIHTDGLESRWDFSNDTDLLSHHPSLACGVAYRDRNRGRDDSTVMVGGFV